MEEPLLGNTFRYLGSTGPPDAVPASTPASVWDQLKEPWAAAVGEASPCL